MTPPPVRPQYLLDRSVISHYWLDPEIRANVDELARSGTLCSSMVTMDEARISARNNEDLAFLTDLYGARFRWLAFDEVVERTVAEVRAALWRIGAGRGAQTTDVLIAATAIRHRAVVVHNDTDFLTVHRAVPAFQQLRIPPRP